MYSSMLQQRVCSQVLNWGQEEAMHSNFRMQQGHSKPGHIVKHGALPSFLTADAPKPAPAVPAWCSPEATPGPGAYESHPPGKDADCVTVPRSAFGATGDGKASRWACLVPLALAFCVHRCSHLVFAIGCRPGRLLLLQCSCVMLCFTQWSALRCSNERRLSFS